jgi:cardiolipin synthase
MEIVDKTRKFQWPKAPRPEHWDEEVLFFDSDQYYADLIKGIEQAQWSIRFETYIFEPGILAERIVGALVAASQRGVLVRILIDGLGSPAFWSNYGKRLRESGVQVRLFRMWPWQIRWLEKPLLLRVFESLRRWWAINRGNHRKTCLIDEEIAWIGSMNVSDNHLREIRGDAAWLDVGVRVRGPELRRLRQAFQSAFKQNFIPGFYQSKRSLLLLNSSLILRQSTKHYQLQRLRKATQRVWIQTPYFVPVPKIYRALIRAAKTGVDVRVMVPKTSDVPLVRHISYAFFRKLLNAGVRIFEYTPRFAHQKVFLIDNWYSVGSTNLNHRSFKHDLEVDVVITHPENCRRLNEKFLEDQRESRELTIAFLNVLPFWRRWLSRTLLIFRYWT